MWPYQVSVGHTVLACFGKSLAMCTTQQVPHPCVNLCQWANNQHWNINTSICVLRTRSATQWQNRPRFINKIKEDQRLNTVALWNLEWMMHQCKLNSKMLKMYTFVSNWLNQEWGFCNVWVQGLSYPVVLKVQHDHCWSKGTSRVHTGTCIRDL